MKRALAALAALLSLAASSESQRTPEVQYMLHCQGCHRPDGSGLPGEVPELRGQVAKFLATPAGREFLVRVPGVANSPLSDRALAELLDWLVRRFDPEHVPADFAPYDAAEVGALRKRALSKLRATRAEIVAELSRAPAAAPPRAGSARPGAAGAAGPRSP